MSNINVFTGNSVSPATTQDAQADQADEAAVEQALQVAPQDPTSAVRRRILAVQNSDGTEAKGTQSSQETASTEVLPTLPTHPVSDLATTKEAVQQTQMLAVTSSDGGAALNGEIAAWIMLNASLKTQQASNAAKIAQDKSQNQAALANADHLLAQIKADQKSSVVSLVGGLAGTLVPFGAMKADVSAQAWAPSLGQAVTGGIDAVNKNVGYGATSYDMQIAQKDDDIQKNIAQQMSQSSQNIAKQSESNVEMALRSISEYFQRITQTNNNIAANV